MKNQKAKRALREPGPVGVGPPAAQIATRSDVPGVSGVSGSNAYSRLDDRACSAKVKECRCVTLGVGDANL